ncbi:hypothetical protein Dsin_002616 [Dipteronia sinensis]|uniref:SWIM-type domain-containing protein n=1 Tax=Dipteronia sinensis TaxID=43782 RepID=A0AAE0B7I7_9ROSI|nr:hypothetical protein Dsin_002616 [Dipteronia sinensis]
MGIPLQSWCIHEFDTHVKVEHTTNNISENLNSWIDELRSLPALHMLESIRRKLMKMANKRLEALKKWDGNVPPAVCKKLAKMQDKGRFVTVLCASETKFEVKDALIYYNVDLENYTCDCGFWQVSGIPCKHAMAVITTKRLNIRDFVHKYLTKEYYLKTYSHVINPIPNEFLWPEIEHIEVLPPMKKKMLGRPKKNRKKSKDEPVKHKRSGGVRCSGCGEFGHNARTCKGCGSTSTHKSVKTGNSSQSAHNISAIVRVSPTNVVGCSQPLTTSGPLYCSQNASQPSQPYNNRANPGKTVQKKDSIIHVSV